MKTSGKENHKAPGKIHPAADKVNKDKNLATEGPLSEKDEVKNAEERTKQAQNENDVREELKIRSSDKRK